MGFKSVYQKLSDVFPQVDARILKAVAIENSKNAEAAVEVMLFEILPHLSQRSMISNAASAKDNSGSVLSDGEAEQREPKLARRSGLEFENTGMNNVEGIPMGEKDVCRSDVGTSTHHAGKETNLNQTADISVDANVDHHQFKGSVESDEVILLEKPQCPFENLQFGPSETGKFMTEGSIGADVERQMAPQPHEFQDAKTSFEHEVQDATANFEHEPAQSDQTNNLIHDNDVSSDDHCVQQTNYSGISSGHELAQSDLTNLVQEIDGIHPTVEQTAEDDAATVNPQDITDCKNVISNHVDKIALLDEAIEDAKNYKKSLFLAMEWIMDMMRKVTIEEEEAELAKAEASRGGKDILKKAEDLKPLLEHAKDANNMHAGEVYGEKAILATELREFQARLLSLSNERDNGLAILDAIRRTLEERLSTAEELKRLAKQEKREKEEAALKLLAEQEAIMEKVVQESKILEQEAEENCKLREFLIDGGRVVDTLQGEISVICEDARLLKQKFDERVPLSQSISSRQTSCILASAGSSLKSIASDRSLDETSDSLKMVSAALSVASLSESVDVVSEKRMLDEGNTPSPLRVSGLSPKKQFEAANVDNNELSDEGWEFCE